MKVIGVTGNSGSGKSTISTIIKNNLGCTVVSADSLAKKINVPGTEYYEKTIELLGREILKEDGTIDRKKLAKIIFSDAEIKANMNKLTAKYVGREILELVKQETRKTASEFIVIDAPLLFECGIYKICDYIIAVTCEEEHVKIKRICERDRLTPAQAKIRLDAQPDNDFYINKSNYVIYNNGNSTYPNLIKGVIKVIRQIKEDVQNKK